MLPRFNILIKPEAELDFLEIRDFYENVSNELGVRFNEAFIASLMKIERNPFHCFSVGKGFRRAAIRDFPYNIYFEIEESIVVIFGIFHQHRDPGEWQKRTK